MGGMLFDTSAQKGIKKKYIPPPMIISFPSNASYKEVIQKGVEKFSQRRKNLLRCFALLTPPVFLLKLKT